MSSRIKYRGSDKEKLKKAEQDEKVLFELDQSEKDPQFYDKKAKEEAKAKAGELERAKEVADAYSGRWNYALHVANYGNHLLGKIDGNDFRAKCIPTDGTRLKVFEETFDTKPGILFVLNFKGKNYARAFFLSRDADIDINAVETVAWQTEETLDFLRGTLAEQEVKDGLILPK
jgi:hypothetical protein